MKRVAFLLLVVTSIVLIQILYIYQSKDVKKDVKKDVRLESSKMVMDNTIKNIMQEQDVKDLEQQVGKIESTEEFMQRYIDLHRERRSHIRESCSIHRKEIPSMKKRPILLVNEKHKMVYCQTPKAGTVSWCRIMLILSGYKDYDDVMKMTAPQVSSAWKKHVPRLSKFPHERQKHIMSTYTKFMFVRHPFTRLLSAYNDKLVSKNGTYARGMAGIRSRIKRDFRVGSKNKTDEIEFVEFVNLVISNSASNVHWNEMHRICYPCDIHYDMIGRFEDTENEAKYLLTLSNVTGLKFPGASGVHLTNSSSDEKIKKAYSSIPSNNLADLYQKYKYDFTLFDYDIPLAI